VTINLLIWHSFIVPTDRVYYLVAIDFLVRRFENSTLCCYIVSDPISLFYLMTCVVALTTLSHYRASVWLFTYLLTYLRSVDIFPRSLKLDETYKKCSGPHSSWSLTKRKLSCSRNTELKRCMTIEAGNLLILNEVFADVIRDRGQSSSEITQQLSNLIACYYASAPIGRRH